jgi:dTDP-4-dehydrorhamnose 3,5-epimerase
VPAPVDFIPTELDGVYLVKGVFFRDQRGFFAETWSEPVWAAKGFHEKFQQDNLSLSARGVLRGMHYQIHPAAMGKLVRCLRGSIFDVAVDLRKGSPSFGKWIGKELSEDNGLALWVPAGFAHGFLALSDHALVHYKCTGFHAPEHERTLAYNCPKVGIAWPFTPTIVSDKDQVAPGLDQAEHNFTYAPKP